MRRILIPTDFSGQAGWAIELATYLAHGSNAELVLLHVIEYPSGESFDADEVVDEYENNGEFAFVDKLISRNKIYLNELAINLAVLGITVIKVLRKGNLFHAIKTITSDFNVDLILMATTRRTIIEEVLDKSRTEQVVKYSEVPVMVVHEKPAQYQFRNIVCAISVRNETTALPQIVTKAQRTNGAKLHLVAVNTTTPGAESELKGKIEVYASKHHLTNYTVNVVDDKREDIGIIRFADIVGADLIVIGTHGRTELRHEVVGNIPQDVINHSRIPVLTYRLSSEIHDENITSRID